MVGVFCDMAAASLSLWAGAGKLGNWKWISRLTCEKSVQQNESTYSICTYDCERWPKSFKGPAADGALILAGC